MPDKTTQAQTFLGSKGVLKLYSAKSLSVALRAYNGLYRHVSELHGGKPAWVKCGIPYIKDMKLTAVHRDICTDLTMLCLG